MVFEMIIIFTNVNSSDEKVMEEVERQIERRNGKKGIESHNR